jgi:hypothetical protein
MAIQKFECMRFVHIERYSLVKRKTQEKKRQKIFGILIGFVFTIIIHTHLTL